VGPEPVGLQLEELRAAAGPDRVDARRAAASHGQHVHAVDRPRRHLVGRGLERQVGLGLGAGERGAHRVEVVLAAEQHRQVPQRGQVHRLVELALGHRALAEEARGDPRPPLHLVGQRQPDGQRQARRRRWRCRRRSGCSASNRCIEPPRPRLHPSTLPNISAMIDAIGTPRQQGVAVLAVGGDDGVVGARALITPTATASSPM
jgi:hypothetical protein